MSFICVFSFAHHFYNVASEVVFVKMPLRLRKRKAKRREEYLLNRDYELERVRYDADAEQRRASARDIYKEQIWSRTELLRGGNRKRILLRCELLRSDVMN